MADMISVKALRKEWEGNEPKEKALMAAGLVFLLLAIVGVFIPIIPQVPFAILSAYLFSKGSRRLHKWVRENKYFGQPVRDWEDHQVVRVKLKAASVLGMVAAAVYGHFKLLSGWAIGLDALLAGIIVFVLTRESKP